MHAGHEWVEAHRRQHGGNTTAKNVDVAQCLAEFGSLAVEHAGIADDREAGHRRRQPLVQPAEDLGFRGLLKVAKAPFLGLVALG